jgi:hypothetical protein
MSFPCLSCVHAWSLFFIIKMVDENQKIDYNVVSEFAGHQVNKGVNIVDAAKDIFKRTKENAMDVAVNGAFITFETVEQLQNELFNAAKGGFNISVYDHVVGG